jgi:hypothetical protein
VKTVELLAYATGSAVSAALVVMLIGGAAFGFRVLEWTHAQSAAVGVAATIAGVLAANRILANLTRIGRRRMSL